MTTPAILDEEPGGQQPLHDEGSQDNGVVVWLLRLIDALVVPAVIVVFFFTFGYLKDEDANKLLQVIVAIIVGVGGVWALYWGMDRLVNSLPSRAASAVRPFTFVGPAMVLLAFYLVWPAINTLLVSLQNENGTEFVGFDNYLNIFTDRQYLISMRNSIVWVLFVPGAAVAVGLGFATLADKLRPKMEAFAKSLIFLPMAISFVGAAVVWTFVYSFRSEGFGDQIGLLNGITTSLGGEAINWLQQTPENNLYLMVILVWLQTGFAMVILSSAIKSVAEDLLEAARIDGASEWQVFWRVVVPSITSTIVVVWTTIVITTWKVFDIVWVTTGGNNDTSVVAERMVTEFFINRNNGVGAALAVVLFVAVIPILVLNIRRFREQEAIR